ncbi:MAG: ring,2-phenylacetyl-CoA epoxidase subunit PaaC [Micromonosporaceae bacterium]|nr:ring,2-phenylacetyl-CoA epoxidase subunit PaaC [Micromonosporaceae bacterium]
MSSDVVEFALRVGDDALVAAQRLAEWSARAPEMEEDVALSNIALDQLGVARLMLTYAGELADGGRDEDDLAYLRGDGEFRNCLLVELPNAGPAASPGTPGDFGVTMAKLLFLSAYQKLLYDRLASSADGRLGAIAAKARKESAYHFDHAAQWTVRLGDGTAQSRARMQSAVDDVWPYTHELFAVDEVAHRLSDKGIAPVGLRPQWLDRVGAVLAEATLTQPDDGWTPTGGRQGRHTEHLSYLLAEMQVLHRAHPGARW